MRTCKPYLHIGLLLAAATLPARAGSFSSDFNTGNLPAGSHTNANAAGGAFLELNGGIGDSGCLKLTKAVNSQNGSFILDDLDAGNPVYGFDVTFKVRIGGGSGTPADGLSLSVSPNLADTSLFGEGGAGSGLSFDWDIYNNPDTPPSPQINVRVAGGVVAWKGYTIAGITTSGTNASQWWTDAHIRLNPDGSLNFDYKGANVFTNFFVPGYQDFVNAGLPVRFGFGARTGGLNANQWIDDLQITTFTQPMLGISQQPISQNGIQGDDVGFAVAVGNANGATFQWLSNNIPIPGATAQSLTVSNIQLAVSGSVFKVTVTGPNNTVTSSDAILTVSTLTLPPSPQLSFNFNEGTGIPPAGTAVYGTAVVDTTGGVDNSGTVKLTTATGGQSGAFVVSDPNAGAPVYGFTARWKMLVGGGSTPPADGFAFAFGNDIPADPTSTLPEFDQGSGLGTGLIVTYDIYNNDNIYGFVSAEAQPAPSIDVRLGGQVLATVHLPVSSMETGDQFGDNIVQLNTDGTLNVVYRGALVFDHLPVPAFASISGGNFALAGRTGGLYENLWVDNFELTTVTTPGAVRITTQPTSQTILVNHGFTNSVVVNDPTGVTYQWYRGANAINGATDSAYFITSVVPGDSGATFTVQATKASVTITSAPVTLTVANLTAPTSPQFSFNFDNGLLPPGTAAFGTYSVAPNGGVGDSGVLHLTDAVNDQNSAFVVTNLVFNGAQVSAISVSFDLREGGGTATPADGFSFNWAAGLTDGTVGGAETGTGNGLSIAFRIYIGAGNADNPPSPYIGVKYKGNFIATTQIPAAQLDTGSDYRTMLLRVDPDGKLYLSYGERVLYNGLQLPNYTFISNSKFGFYGRTGGANENQWFDNIKIQATQSSGPLSITTQPADATVIAGLTATFSVSLSDPNGATYQWFKNNTSIGGATLASYTTPATVVGDSGSTLKVTATGPSGTVTSSNALLTVVPAITISNPQLSYNFDDGAVPPDTTLNGSGDPTLSPGGFITPNGGVSDSGCLHLTDAVNGQGGTFIIPDPFTNAPVSGLTVYFAARVGGGTIPPADGFSFVWCPSNDLPSNIIFGEDGAGGNLIVSVDIYDNGNETPPAPSIDVRYKGSLVATKQIPYQQLETGNNFADFFIKISTTGVLDLQYNGMAIFNQVALPGYTALAGGEFAFGGRTGGLNENQWIDNIQIAGQFGLIPVPLNFTFNGTQLTLTWPLGWKLQATPGLSPSNWQDVQGATSPYPVNTTTGAGQFYRLAPAP